MKTADLRQVNLADLVAVKYIHHIYIHIYSSMAVCQDDTKRHFGYFYHNLQIFDAI